MIIFWAFKTCMNASICKSFTFEFLDISVNICQGHKMYKQLFVFDSSTFWFLTIMFQILLSLSFVIISCALYHSWTPFYQQTGNIGTQLRDTRPSRELQDVLFLLILESSSNNKHDHDCAAELLRQLFKFDIFKWFEFSKNLF